MTMSMPRAAARKSFTRISFATAALAAAAILGAVSLPQQALALPANPTMSVPQLTENVACRVVRSQVIRPGGRVSYRTRTVCTPSVVRPRARCTMERQRIVRPNGAVVFKTVRRCR